MRVCPHHVVRLSPSSGLPGHLRRAIMASAVVDDRLAANAAVGIEQTIMRSCACLCAQGTPPPP